MENCRTVGHAQAVRLCVGQLSIERTALRFGLPSYTVDAAFAVILRYTRSCSLPPAPVPPEFKSVLGMEKPPFGHLSHTHRILVGVPFKGPCPRFAAGRTNPLTGMVQSDDRVS